GDAIWSGDGASLDGPSLDGEAALALGIAADAGPAPRAKTAFQALVASAGSVKEFHQAGLTSEGLNSGLPSRWRRSTTCLASWRDWMTRRSFSTIAESGPFAAGSITSVRSTGCCGMPTWTCASAV